MLLFISAIERLCVVCIAAQKIPLTLRLAKTVSMYMCRFCTKGWVKVQKLGRGGVGEWISKSQEKMNSDHWVLKLERTIFNLLLIWNSYFSFLLLLQASYRDPTGPENPRILFQHFPGSFSPGKRLQVLESPGNLLTVTQ